ncbi:MAG: efflux RND transporter periplasmic adaptor subunit [Campylobacterota bacterium]|nr:efflux RND transporter periplasmic adaptor subunit [Campylobacterota bacterium]
MKKVIVIILILLLGFVAIKFLKEKKASVAGNGVALLPSYTVKVVTPTNKSIRKKRSFLAQVQSAKRANVSSKMSGFITNLHVKESQLVSKGDLLVTIDAREVQAAINGLQANLSSLSSDVTYTKGVYTKNQKLFKAGGLAKEKLDASEVLYRAKKAALITTRENIKAKTVQLDYLKLRAPYDGKVGTIFLRDGDMALPGKTILSLNSTNKKLLLRYIPQNDFKLSVGQNVYMNGNEVARLDSHYADASGGLDVMEAEVITTLTQANGAYINVEIYSNKIAGCSVPLNTLVHNKEGVSVVQYIQGKFETLHVNIKAQNSDDALISPCPSVDVATASEAKLSLLPTLSNVSVKR